MIYAEAIKIRDEYLQADSPYIIAAYATNKQGTDNWFVDVVWFYAHRNDDQYDFEKIGYHQ